VTDLLRQLFDCSIHCIDILVQGETVVSNNWELVNNSMFPTLWLTADGY